MSSGSAHVDTEPDAGGRATYGRIQGSEGAAEKESEDTRGVSMI